MERTEESPSENGTTVSPTAGNLDTPGNQSTAEEVAKGPAGTSVKDPPDEAEQEGKAAPEGAVSEECLEDSNVLDELKVDLQGEATGKKEAKGDLAEEEGGKEETAVASQEETGRKEDTTPEPSEVKEKEEATLALEKQKSDGKEANLDSKEKLDVSDKAKPEPKEGAGAEVQEAETESQKKADVKDQANAELQAVHGKEIVNGKEIVDGKEVESGTKQLVVSRAERRVSSPLFLGNRGLPDSLVGLLLLLLLQNPQAKQFKGGEFYFGLWFQRFLSWLHCFEGCRKAREGETIFLTTAKKPETEREKKSLNIRHSPHWGDGSVGKNSC